MSSEDEVISKDVELVNNRTLKTFFNPRMWWVDIELPNKSVDMSSWVLSTCYPWRTFDLLSKSPSARNSRITMVNFRLYSTSRSHNQAGLYHYAHEQNLAWAYFHTSPLRFRRHLILGCLDFSWKTTKWGYMWGKYQKAKRDDSFLPMKQVIHGFV